jgi:excisionase family DNA binding protein
MSQRVWTAEDRSIVDAMLAKGERYQTIAKRLGTTWQAVNGQCERWNIRQQNSCDLLTGMDVARLFGVHKHTVYSWKARGWLHAHGRGYQRRFRMDDVLSFIQNVDAWMAWQPERMTDDTLRAEAVLARANGPQWLTTADIAARFYVQIETVSLWIKQGYFPATMWCQWWIRSDHLAAFVAPCMRNNKGA